jgi:24-methylenesterol C-methyltransferase
MIDDAIDEQTQTPAFWLFLENINNSHIHVMFQLPSLLFVVQLEIVYSEIFRVLKPGGSFVSQEWVSTPKYDGSDAEHKRIIEEINFGNSLPNMRTWDQAEAAGKTVGFELVSAYDAAEILIGPNRPWFERLTQFRHLHHVDDIIIKVLGTIRIIPKTLIDVHTMLVRVAYSLIEGGQSGVFTPMYMLCFKKPAA